MSQSPFNSIKSRLSLGQSPRSSQSEGLMSKVPHEMRSSLRQNKIKQKKSLNLTDIYQDFKNVIYSHQECGICLQKASKGSSIADCEHIFCSQCLVNYITFKINSMEEILCPSEGCDKKLDVNSDTFKNLPETYKQKHKKQQLWQQTIKNPDLKLCPIEKCHQGTVNMRKIPPQCDKCHTKFCHQCMMTEHPQRPCDENIKLNFKQWRRCPKCSIFIQKNEGCNHMVCRCKHEFCFVCLSAWDVSHYSCLQNMNVDLLQVENISCPRVVGGLMAIGIPFLVIFGLVAMAFCLVVFLVGGFLAGIYFCVQSTLDCCWLVIILLPICAIVLAFVAGIWGTFYYIFPLLSQQFTRYNRTIKNLCSVQ